ncbi:hypothetical protein FB451DRAFT_1269123 [Mycena latifolia]|nr:hypothetical protein FB451DRAFT_1269123 [Mycena latifolia]
MLNILVLHGYMQTAGLVLVAHNTQKLRAALDGVATLHYVEGPRCRRRPPSSRPWWFLGQGLEVDASRGARWDDVMQRCAMAALLLSMLNHPERVPGFTPAKKQEFKFGIFCSGFVSHTSSHTEIYGIPDIPTLHTLDDRDTVVRAARTVVFRHSEGYSIPVGGDFPTLFRDFILEATK